MLARAKRRYFGHEYSAASQGRVRLSEMTDFVLGSEAHGDIQQLEKLS